MEPCKHGLLSIISRGAAIEVQNVDDLTWLNASYVPILKQLQDAETQNYYFTGAQDSKSAIKFFILAVDTTTSLLAELEIQEEVADETKHIMKLGLEDLD